MGFTATARRRVVLFAALAVGTLAVPAAAVATVTVNTTTDSAGGGCVGTPNDCSLRQAIEKATPGETVEVPAGTYTLTLGSLSIEKGIVVHGAGARSTSVLVGSGAGHVFSVSSSAVVELTGMTISAGHQTGTGSTFQHGGAILNGTGSLLTLRADAISGTTLEKTDTAPIPVRGAGIANNGTLAIFDSTISGNSQHATGSGPVVQGAGIFNSGGTLTILNSTIAGNSQVAQAGASSSGAAIESLGTSATLRGVTVAGNTGAAAIHTIGQFEIEASIVANGPAQNCAGVLVSLGHNLESADECGLHAAGDLVGRDPLLGPLADNGGPTDTMALLPGSPAIDAVPPPCLPADQRGIARPQIGACDIGAFELVPSPPSNAFKFGRLKRNKRKGTATLVVIVPGPGVLTASGVTKSAKAAGQVKLPVRAKGKAKRKLERTGVTRFKLKVTYTPTGGAPNTLTKRIKLIERG